MIFLDSPIYNVNGLIVMSDDHDPLQWYYYPTNPRLALNPDGTPTFLFVRFKTDAPVPPGVESGGGFLNFDVDLRVDQDAIDDAVRQIRSMANLTSDPRLVPLQYRTGTTRLIFLDAAAPPAAPGTPTPVTPTANAQPGLQFVESASYPTSPSLYGDNRSTFSAYLSPQGATLVKACLDAPTFLAGVSYDLTFVGLRPAFHVTLVVDWNQVHNYLENQFHSDVHVPAIVTVQTDIDTATEKLIESRVIQLNVVSYAAGAADADITKEKDKAVDWVKNMITEAFFKPSINPTSLSGDAKGGAIGKTADAVKGVATPGNVGYSLKSLSDTNMKNLNVNLTEQDAEEVRIVPQGHLAGLMDVLKGQPLENFYREVDLNDPFFQRVSVDVSVSSVFVADHVDNIVVNLQYAGANAQPHAVTLDANNLTKTVEWELDPKVGMTYSYTVTISFKPDAFLGDATEVTGDPQTSNTPKIVIDPRAYYTILNVDIEAPAIPWKNYAQVLVEIAPDDDKEGLKTQAFTLNSASPKGTWSLRPADKANVGYRYRKTYVPLTGGPVVVDWVSSASPIILVSDLDTDALNITVTTNLDFAKIPRVLVTMEYKDPANGIDNTDVLQLNSQSPLIVWPCPVVDKTKRDYTYGVTLFYADHSVKTFPPIPGTQKLLTILDTFSQTMNVVVSASGADFDTAGLDRIEVVLAYSDGSAQSPAPTTIVLHALTDTGIFSYQVHDPAHQSYTYSGTYYAKNGFNQQIAQQTTDTLSLVIPITT